MLKRLSSKLLHFIINRPATPYGMLLVRCLLLHSVSAMAVYALKYPIEDLSE